jgi:hypothetical protein
MPVCGVLRRFPRVSELFPSVSEVFPSVSELCTIEFSVFRDVSEGRWNLPRVFPMLPTSVPLRPVPCM